MGIKISIDLGSDEERGYFTDKQVILLTQTALDLNKKLGPLSKSVEVIKLTFKKERGYHPTCVMLVIIATDLYPEKVQAERYFAFDPRREEAMTSEHMVSSMMDALRERTNSLKGWCQSLVRRWEKLIPD